MDEKITLTNLEQITMLNTEQLKPLAYLFITPVAFQNSINSVEGAAFTDVGDIELQALKSLVDSKHLREKEISYGPEKDDFVLLPDHNLRLILIDLLSREELIDSVDRLCAYYEEVFIQVTD